MKENLMIIILVIGCLIGIKLIIKDIPFWRLFHIFGKNKGKNYYDDEYPPARNTTILKKCIVNQDVLNIEKIYNDLANNEDVTNLEMYQLNGYFMLTYWVIKPA